jgi:hypothetical protein
MKSMGQRVLEKMFDLRFAGGMDSSMMIGQANVLGTQGTITRTAGALIFRRLLLTNM